MAGRDFEFRIIGDNSSGVRAVEEFGSKLKSNFDQGKQAAEVFKGSFAGSFLGNAASDVVGGIASAMGDMIGEAAQASDATDKFKQSLNFAGLKTNEIDALTKSTQDYADKTVYSLGDIQNITAQLASNSVPNYDKLAQAAGNLNAAAGGNAETFKSVGMVLTQTAGQGKLTTENWNQLSDAIPGASGLLQEALLKAGAYTGNFRDAMQKGEISADEFNAALLTLGSKPVAVEAATSTSTFEGALGNLQATIVGKLAGAFNTVKPIITGFVSGFGDFISNIDQWTPLLAGLGTAILIGVAPAIWAAVTATAAWTVALLANPITWIILAIVALVAGIVWLIMNWDTAVKWISDVWSGFMSWITGVIEGFVGWWNGVWSAVGQWISDVWNGFVGWVQSVWNGFWAFIVTALTLYIEFWVGIWNAVASFVSGVWTGFVNWIVGVWNGFIAFMVAALNGYVSFWVGIWNGIAGFVTGIWNGIVGAVSGAIGWVGSAIQNGLNFINQVWSNIWGGLAGVVRGVFNGVLGWIESGINGAIDLINGMIGAVNNVSGAVGIHIGTIGHVGLPRLATGGLTNGPMVALIGDNPGGREIVTPLDQAQEQLERVALAAAASAMGQPSTQVAAGQPATGPVRLDDYSLQRLGQIIVDGINRGGTKAVFDSLS